MYHNFDSISHMDTNNNTNNEQENNYTFRDFRRNPCQIAKEYIRSVNFIELLCCTIVGAIIAFIPNVIVPINQRPIPYQITAENDAILDLTKYQEWVEPTVSSISNIIISFAIPLILQIFIGLCYGAPKDTHLTICVYALANGFTIGLTNILKNYIGYLRPNFYNRCSFTEDTLMCNDSEEEEKARLSFPSGHSSLSFCGMTIFTLYLLRVFGVGGVNEKLLRPNSISPVARRVSSVLCLLPMLVCIFVAGTRVHDNYHHPVDVVGGALIGWGCARAINNIW